MRFVRKLTDLFTIVIHKHFFRGAAAVMVCLVIVAVMPVTIPVIEEAETAPVIITTPAPVQTPAPAPVLTPAPEPTPDPMPTPEPEPPQMLTHLEPLYMQNNDLAGWLKIENTVVDYPVMYTPEDGEFYLYRTFDKEDDPSLEGSLFIDKNCTVDPQSTNLIIHGHNMRNGTMFAPLLKYKDEKFFLENPVFEYSTLFETAEYEIVAVFLSKVFYVNEDVFKFYKFYDAQTEEEFNDFVRNIKALSLYDTGVTAQFGDQLITLTTCEYSVENGRFVVVGRRSR